MFKRPDYLKSRLVRVIGHAGQPEWGVPVSRKRHTKRGCFIDVVTVGLSLLSARRQTVRSEHVRPANLLACPLLILDNLVVTGVINRSERRTWLAQIRALWLTTTKRSNITRIETTVLKAGPCPVQMHKTTPVGHVAFIR